MEEKKNNKGLVIGICIVIILAICCGIFTYKYIKDMRDNDISNTDNNAIKIKSEVNTILNDLSYENNKNDFYLNILSDAEGISYFLKKTDNFWNEYGWSIYNKVYNGNIIDVDMPTTYGNTLIIADNLEYNRFSNYFEIKKDFNSLEMFDNVYDTNYDYYSKYLEDKLKNGELDYLGGKDYFDTEIKKLNEIKDKYYNKNYRIIKEYGSGYVFQTYNFRLDKIYKENSKYYVVIIGEEDNSIENKEDNVIGKMEVQLVDNHIKFGALTFE